jgi:hypothetical protein
MTYYNLKCRKPEYIHDRVLFPEVWTKLCEALDNRDLLLAGLETQLLALENSEEVEELQRIERQLDKLHERELSYAEQRADGSISKAVHIELNHCLVESKRELLQVREQLSQKAKMIEDSRQQRDTAHNLVKALPETLPILSREEQESLIMALISRVDVSSINQVSITLRLHPDVTRDLPNLRAESSHQLGLGLSDDSQKELSDSSKSLVLAQHGQQVNAAHCRHSRDCRPG